jgi:multimeric flavodoxin WrbA
MEQSSSAQRSASQTFTVGINGSPRTTGNTARLLESALKGTEDAGSNTELINLYDLTYKGCRSCLSCKREGSSCYGRCAIKDDLTKVLEKIRKADVLVLGSPVYYGTVTGEMRSFLERLLFPYMAYAGPDSSLFEGSVNAGFIYAMGMPRERFDEYFRQSFDLNNDMIRRDFGNLDILYSFDTILTADRRFRVETQSEHELERKKAEFLADCRKAYELGKRLATQF